MKKSKLAVVAMSIAFSSLFLSRAAYAGTSISVANSGGAISFGKVQPSASGTVTTASDTLTITTDCSAGSNVYISAVNGSSNGTSLVNNAADSNNTISALSSTTIGSTALALSNNTWGFNTDNSASGANNGNGIYYGLPTYANAMEHAIYSGTNTTIPIYYGAKVTSALTPGKYTGQVLYTATVNSSCLNYTVIFNKNANDATGTMSNQTMAPSAATPLTTNAFERPGYVFLGWSTDQNAATPTYTDGQSVTDIAPGGGSVTLYAVWGRTMQDWATNFGCAALNISEFITLYDTRDKKGYAVKKLPDGKCWMIQNLTLNGVELTSQDTNFTSGGPYYLPKDGGAGSLTSSSTKDAASGYNFTSNNDNRAMFKFRSKDSNITNDSDTGYYNFYTATLGFSSYNDGKASGSSTQDICPKGWKLPWVSDSGTTASANGDFLTLAKSYKSNASWSGTNTSPSYYTSDDAIKTGMHIGTTASNNNYAGFSYAGNYNGTSLVNVGSVGTYWSSSVYNTSYGYRLYFGSSSDIYPQNDSGKYGGYSIRCVAQTSDATGWMQDFDCSNLASGGTTILADKRDGQEYSIYRIPTNATYPNTSTIANVASKCLMTKDLNLGAVNSIAESDSTITANGTMTLNSADSNFTVATGSGESITYPTSTITVSNNTGSWSSTNSFSNKQYTTSGTGNYAGRGYYSWGAAMVVCPKGWRLPSIDEYANGSNSGWENFDIGIAKLVKGDNAAQSINNITSSPWSFVVNGDYYSNNFYDINSLGNYWSSTQYSSTNSQFLRLSPSNGLVGGGGNKQYGFAVRCIAKENMQDVDVASLPEGQTSILNDKRDNQDYTVYRWPSTGTAGSSYPTGMAGYAIMTKDLSLGYVTGGSVTRGGDLVLTTDESTATGTVAARTGTSDWSTDGSNLNSQYINGTGGTYDSHSYYSYGAAQKVCPTGWRLLTKTEYDSMVTFVGGDNSTGTSKITNFPYNFSYSGRFAADGLLYAGQYGYYWSSASYSDNEGYRLFIMSNSLASGNGGKWAGMSVRCIASPN